MGSGEVKSGPRWTEMDRDEERRVEKMTRNTLMDLNNALFEQLERLNDEDINIEEELPRVKAIDSIAKNIIDNARLALDAEKFKDDRMNADRKLPRMLSDGNE